MAQAGNYRNRALRTRRIQRLAVAAAVWLAMLSLPVQGEPRAQRTPQGDGKFAGQMAALASNDPERQLAALEILRTDPEQARLSLASALQRKTPLPGRWRLAHRLVEFGGEAEVPLLVALHGQSESAWERQVIRGALEALYQWPGAGTDLTTVVRVFSFIQTRPPAHVGDNREGKWMLTEWSFRVMHREDFPLPLINRLTTFKGAAHSSNEALQKAMARRVGRRNWKRHEEFLTGLIEQIPGRVRFDGVAQVRLANPLPRPLALSVGLDVWFGQLREEPEPALVYLEPNGEALVKIPVSLLGSAVHPRVRLDLRVSHFNGPLIPVFQKLYLELNP